MGNSEPKYSSALEKDFLAFHKANPHVWLLFRQFARAAMARRKTYSSNAIIERIRWYTDIETHNDDAGFKVNNNHRAYYARMWKAQFPSHADFLRTRKLRS